MKKAQEKSYDIIILDAFSSDSIPTHLVTKEAVSMYLEKLKENGVIAFHITNNYLDLRPVLSNLAKEFNLVAYSRNDFILPEEEKNLGKKPSMWLIVARDRKDLGSIAYDQNWKMLPGDLAKQLWTDDFTNIVSVFKWKKADS